MLLFKLLCTSLIFASLTLSAASLEEHFQEAQKSVSLFSSGNANVLRVSNTFFAELQKVYVKGEGMIEKDIHQILDAVSFSANKHRDQIRKDLDQTPYIIHPIGVAYNLLMIGKVRDPDILIGALLHDTVEDTNTSFEEIRSAFGERVEEFVREVTDDKSLPALERKRLQIVHAPHKSAGAAQIKLGDKLYNLNDLLRKPPADWTTKRVDAYFTWTDQVTNALPWVNASLKKAVDGTIAAYLRKS